MPVPPLEELYGLLRGAGFVIGIDDHIRIGRLLEHDAAWTLEMLHTSIGALVVKSVRDHTAFDACWTRWLRSAQSYPHVPEGLHPEPAPTLPRERPRLPVARRSFVLPTWMVAGLALAVLALVLAVQRCSEAALQANDRGVDPAAGADRSPPIGSARDQQPASAPAGAGESTATPAPVTELILPKANHFATGQGPANAPPDAGSPIPTPPLPSNATPLPSYAILPATAREPADVPAAVGAPTATPATATEEVVLSGAIDPVDVAIVLGEIVLFTAALVAVVVARARRSRGRRRRRFLRGPWRYALTVPRAAQPALPREAIEDAATGLGWRTPTPNDEIDVVRSVVATAERGGSPTLIHRRSTAAAHHVVLEDIAGGAERWSFLYDELWRGLAREGIDLERYTFAANPEQCVGRGGGAALGELIDHADAMIVIGNGDAAIDPLDGTRAAWLALLRQVPRRLWINPVPPARWSPGARAIAADMPTEHGVTSALAALHGGGGRRRPDRAFPAVIERAPDSVSGLAALYRALGKRAFRLVAALAVVTPPTMAAARWLAELFALELDEHDWLGIAALPWFRSGRWYGGLPDRLADALAADDPEFARRVTAVADRLFLNSEPRRESAAHLAWEIDRAYRAGRRGKRAAAVRALRRLTETPLGDRAQRMLVALDPPRRAWRSSLIRALAGHRSSSWLRFAGGVAAVVVAIAATLLDRSLVEAADRAWVEALVADVVGLAATFDEAARFALLRADQIATTPRLRSDIETDGATSTDMGSTGMVFIPGRGEVLEVFQLRGDRSTPLLRIPKTASPVQPLTGLQGRATRFQSDGQGVTLAASAPISGYRAGVAGILVISTPIDLTAIRRAFDAHASYASLDGLGPDILLTGSRDNQRSAPIKLVVPSYGNWSAGSAAVLAVPRPAVHVTWVVYTRNTAGIIGALLLASLVVSIVRSHRRRRSSARPERTPRRDADHSGTPARH